MAVEDDPHCACDFSALCLDISGAISLLYKACLQNCLWHVHLVKGLREIAVSRTHRSNLLSSSHPACLAWLPALVQDARLFTVIIESRLKALVWAVDSSSVEPALRHQSRETTIPELIKLYVQVCTAATVRLRNESILLSLQGR